MMLSGVNENAWQVKSLVTNSNNLRSSSKIHKRPSVKCVPTYTKHILKKNPSVKKCLLDMTVIVLMNSWQL